MQKVRYNHLNSYLKNISKLKEKNKALKEYNKASNKLTETKNKISEIWTNIQSWFNTNVAPKFTLSYWTNKFDTMKQGASQKLTEVKNTITNIWNSIKSWFGRYVAPIFTKNYWVNKFNSIKEGIRSALNNIKDTVSNIVGNIKDKINSIGDKISSGISGVANWFSGNSRSTTYSLRSANVPQMATGGIATRSTIVEVGEAGREGILPLENNTGWMDVLADKIAARNGTAPSKIVLKVGERELGWATINSINQITKQTGGLQLQL